MPPKKSAQNAVVTTGNNGSLEIPTKSNEVPKTLKPYTFHGIPIKYEGKEETLTDCVWCGREKKLSFNRDTGKWKCWVCLESGNQYGFIRKLWEESDKQDKNGEYKVLAEEKKLLYPESLEQWGIVKSITTGDWILPGYNVEGQIVQLYRYLPDLETRKKRWIPTTEVGHGFHCCLADLEKFRGKDGSFTYEEVAVTEGIFDGIALWEVMKSCKSDNNKLVATANNVGLLTDTLVIAVPGVGSIGDPLKKWLTLFEKKRVTTCFDSDHARYNRGKRIEPAGYGAGRKTYTLLMSQPEDKRPTSVQWLEWGKEGFDKNKATGYDVRDYLTEEQAATDKYKRIQQLETLLDKVTSVPDSWITEAKEKVAQESASKSVAAIEIVPCESYEELRNQWKKAMKWYDGLDTTLITMLASIASTNGVEEPIWIRVISPASTGKTSLCEGLGTNVKYIEEVSILRGLHSGWAGRGESEADAKKKDNSLLAKLYGRTLVIKDGDTLLQSPNRSQILSEFRDAYDCNSSTNYRHGVNHKYRGLRFTVILCGTPSLYVLNDSELGERFLDICIMDRIVLSEEMEILERVAYRVATNSKLQADGKLESHYSPAKAKAMAMTGGYIEHLRNNVALVEKVDFPEDHLLACINLGRFTAFMRGKPSIRQGQQASREMGGRLVSQLTKLANYISFSLQKTEVDKEVMRIVKKVALDTSKGDGLKLCNYLYKFGAKGATVDMISTSINMPETELRKLLAYEKDMGVVQHYLDTGSKLPVIRWTLTDTIYELMTEVNNYGY